MIYYLINFFSFEAVDTLKPLCLKNSVIIDRISMSSSTIKRCFIVIKLLRSSLINLQCNKMKQNQVLGNKL